MATKRKTGSSRSKAHRRAAPRRRKAYSPKPELEKRKKNRPAIVKPAKPSRPKPSKGKPSRPKPAKGKPSRPKPAKGKPSRPKPSKGKPSRPKPAKGKPSRPKQKGKVSAGRPKKEKPSTLPIEPQPTPPVRIEDGFEIYRNQSAMPRSMKRGWQRRNLFTHLEDAIDKYSTIGGRAYFIFVEEDDPLGGKIFIPYFVPEKWEAATGERYKKPPKRKFKKTGSGSRFRQ